MLLRIALAIAILAGIGVTVLNFVQVKEKVTTVMTERDDFKDKYQKTSADLSKTKTELTKANSDLDKTKKDLESTRTERDTAVADAERYRKDATQTKDQLAKTASDLKAKQQELTAWDVTGLKPAQVLALVLEAKKQKADLLAVTNEWHSTQQQLANAEVKLRKLLDESYEVPEPNVLSKVVVVDPKYGFVVLEGGQDKGFVVDGDMLISRDGKLVAKVRIGRVERERSIANVLPGFSLASVIEGDLAVAKKPKL